MLAGFERTLHHCFTRLVAKTLEMHHHVRPRRFFELRLGIVIELVIVDAAGGSVMWWEAPCREGMSMINIFTKGARFFSARTNLCFCTRYIKV